MISFSCLKKKLRDKYTELIIHKPIIKVGQRYIDKKWEDSIIRITAISKDESEIRYEYLIVEGKATSIPRLSHTRSIGLLELYKIITD